MEDRWGSAVRKMDTPILPAPFSRERERERVKVVCGSGMIGEDRNSLLDCTLMTFYRCGSDGTY
jgi:hypothetical protein